MSLSPGTRIGDYEIRSLLGAGGMGEVYRAHDPRLDREVAIKVLPAFVSDDPDRLRRFEQEARAAAALNHPNILAVYQLGTFQESLYLVSELLDGEPLRDQLVRGRPGVRKTIDYAVQVARGLAAAHEKGIVHRDLKPENLFVTRDGRVKILDFGLAKLLQPQAAPSHSAVTVAGHTDPGVVMGTAGYMAPEQVRGGPLDHRADIFSFGSILYEALTGTRAFARPTSVETMSAILNDDPPDIASVAPAVPTALQRIVRRCLEKHPDQRFQSASDLAFALEALSDSGTTTAPVHQPASRERPRRRWVYAAVGGAVAVIAASAALLLFLWPARSALVPPSEWVQLTDLADSATAPAFSPDGRMLTFLRGDDPFVTSGQVYVMLLPRGTPVRLTNDASSKMSPVFSPDGGTIAYTVPWDTWTVPVLGGPPRLWLPNASGLTWTAADTLLFSQVTTGNHMEIVSSTLNRTNTRRVYSPPAATGMAHRSYLSPDRTRVLLAEMTGNFWNRCRLVPADGSSRGVEVGPAEGACTAAAWSLDGTWMYLNSNAGGAYHVWRQRVSDNRLEQVTAGPTEEVGIAMAPDGQSFVTAVGLHRSSVWLHDPRGARVVTSEARAALADPRNGSPVSPDGGKLYYLVQRTAMRQVNVSQAMGELWELDLQSGATQAIMPGFEITDFSISPDNREFVFSALDDAKDIENLWISPLDRSASPRKLQDAANRARYAPGFIYYVKRPGGRGRGYVHRIRPDGTGDERIRNEEVLSLATSPDGRFLAMTLPASGKHAWTLQLVEVTTGRVQPVCPDAIAYWSGDGRSLFVTSGIGKIGEAATYVVDFPPGGGMPPLPPAGLSEVTQFAGQEHVRSIPARLAAPGMTADTYAFVKESTQRNLYRVPLR